MNDNTYFTIEPNRCLDEEKWFLKEELEYDEYHGLDIFEEGGFGAYFTLIPFSTEVIDPAVRIIDGSRKIIAIEYNFITDHIFLDIERKNLINLF